ncbi:DNA gyrase inhibitor YacG [Marinibacterium profundimaris]|uniref:DNA gyrase inhibitor YacG n=1 Tax=Marinibacterium profundimaris TaxID=1679460 RepID=A0A225NHM3_9RHOB|nr:DNA gyrase inhibitor YacG [Marinibacterium profundimaris]OWU73244.1 DNA gyrase inhibitor [Marinibacterium profundimaris]
MTCPICQSETDRKYRPFCSRRCADLDLGRWMTGSYSLPMVEQDDDLEELLEEPTRRSDLH